MTEKRFSINIDVNKLTKYQWAGLILIACIVSAGLAVGSNAFFINVDIQQQLQALEDQVNIPVNSTISAFLKEASYIVSTHNVSGTIYYCLINGTDDRAGRLEYYSPNATQVISFAIGNCTTIYPETIVLKGNFSVEQMVLKNNVIIDAYGARITQVGSSNKALVTNANPTTNNYGMEIHGGTWDGNRSYQTTGNVFDFACATDPPGRTSFVPIYGNVLKMRDVTVMGYEENGIKINFTGASGGTVSLQDVSCQYGDEYGLYMYRVVDSEVVGGMFEGDIGAIYWFEGMSIKLHPSYINAKIVLEGFFASDIGSWFQDSNSNRTSLELGGLKYSTVHDIRFRISGSSGYVSYPAILLRDSVPVGYTSYNNSFCNIYVGRTNGGGTNKFTYAIEEADANQDFNLYTNIQGSDTVSGSLHILSLHSKVVNIMGYSPDFFVSGLPFSYMIFANSTATYMVNGTDGTIPYSSTNASKVINFAVGNCSSSGNVFFKTGQYALNGSIIDNGVGHITLIFEDGAKLYVPNGMNQPAIYLSYVNYWSIEGVEIDGNAANQGAPSGAVHADGIVMNFCNFSTVKDGYIYNCRRFGINIIGASHGSGADGNTVLTCGWNGINLGGATDTFDCYATDNLVAYFSDVGITSYCNDGRITGNTVYAANGTTGSNNAGWGIASEALGNCTIADNTVYNVTYGIRATVGCHRVEIKDNRIYQVSNVGIYLEGSNYTSLDGNMVWSWGAFAVQLDVSHWVKIRGNTLNGTYGIFTNSDYGFCMGNWISASDYGIAAASGANYTRIIENDLRFCSSSIYEAGGAGNIYGNNVWSNGTYDNTPP